MPDRRVPLARLLVGLGASALITLAALLVAVTLEGATGGGGIAAHDRAIRHWFLEHHTQFLDDLFHRVTRLGSLDVVVPLIVVAVALLAWLRHPRLAFGVGVAVVGSSLTVGVLKPLVGRAGPPLGDHISGTGGGSFPSGHSATAMAALGILAWAVTRLVTARSARFAIWATAAVLVGAVGVSRVYLGLHWPSDVLGGWFVGAAWVAAAIGLGALLTRVANLRAARAAARRES